MTDSAWVQDLLKEKSLWETFNESRRFPASLFNRRVRKGLFPLIAAGCLVASWTWMDAASLNRGIDAMSSTLVSVSATIIGFLVAGLAIFTTLSDKRILRTLAQTPQKGTEVSSFKYLYFNLLNIFVIYIALLVLSSVILAFSRIAITIPPLDLEAVIFPTAAMANGVVISLLLIAFAEAVLCLKTFVWNIYATFVSVLTVSSILDDNSPPGT